MRRHISIFLLIVLLLSGICLTGCKTARYAEPDVRDYVDREVTPVKYDSIIGFMGFEDLQTAVKYVDAVVQGRVKKIFEPAKKNAVSFAGLELEIESEFKGKVKDRRIAITYNADIYPLLPLEVGDRLICFICTKNQRSFFDSTLEEFDFMTPMLSAAYVKRDGSLVPLCIFEGDFIDLSDYKAEDIWQLARSK